jgi:hypothetical protein
MSYQRKHKDIQIYQKLYSKTHGKRMSGAYYYSSLGHWVRYYASDRQLYKLFKPSAAKKVRHSAEVGKNPGYYRRLEDRWGWD